MKRLCWSTLCLAALATQVAAAPAAISVDGTTQTVAPRIPAPGAGRQFQGLAVTDYFSFEQNYSSPANPQLAVGPDDILGIVNRQIFRLPNPNAPGVTPATNPNAQKAFLDVWIGEPALNELCPTSPRTAFSCLFEHATVKYDQMHGRFVVLFTVTDTGVTMLPTGATAVTQNRKSSWVILVSRYAVLSTRDAVVPAQGNSDIFVNPTPPGNFTGGVNQRWFVWYGGSQGWGSPNAGGTTGPGNINALPGITNASNVFNCAPGAIQSVDGQGAVTPVSSVCYLPTAARLGIDNDTITIVSPVINANVLAPSPFNNPPTNMPAYAGNRVRVIKKGVLYTQVFSSLTAGNQFAGTPADRFTGAYYDLYTSVNDAGDPVTTTAFVPYTAIASPTVAAPTGATQLVTPGAPGVTSENQVNQLSPLFYEPAHLRGRALATFSNSPTGNKSQTYLVGSIATPSGVNTANNQLFIQAIQHIYPAGNIVFPGPDAGPLGEVLRFYPVLKSGIDPDSASTRRGTPVALTVAPFTDPATVPQAPGRNVGNPTNPNIFVGDSRPHSVIFREGHLYLASVRNATPANQVTFSSNPLATTVAYNVIQKGFFPTTPTAQAGSLAVPGSVIAAHWQNARTYAPMYDTPASVSRQGIISPINLFPYLEKLFVGTTNPPLTPDLSGGTDPRYLDVTGAVVPNCTNAQTNPSTSGETLAWPGLFDIKCGEDPYDGPQPFRNPATGAIETVNPFGIRGGAATDPNDLSLWVYGAYARRRLATVPTGQWGTYGANYKLQFQASDPYNNPNSYYTDVSIDPASANFRASAIYAQIARQLGLGPTGSTFGPDTPVTRAEMAQWVILGQMDETAVTDYLNNTPQFGAANSPSFADVPTTHPQFRYIEVMYRRGYTKGCVGNDVIRLYCPTAIITRGQMAVFLIRAKLNNVFPTVLSGCPVTPTGGVSACGLNGDNFGLFVPTQPYFTDNPPPVATNPATAIYPYIQKIAELRISNGFSLGPAGIGLNGVYGPDDPLTREQIAVFVIRAFHP